VATIVDQRTASECPRPKAILGWRAAMFPIVIATMLLTARGADQGRHTAARSGWVTLADRYTLLVPQEFKMHDFGTAMQWPSYGFDSGKTTFDVTVVPYSVNGDSMSTDCKVSREWDRGDLSAPIYCEAFGATADISGSFEISGGRRVYFGWVVDDNSQECTSGSPCPHYVIPSRRYSIYYFFLLPDKQHHKILEFHASDAARSATPEVHDLRGVAVLLREVVIPTLTPIQ
jgi:hypothetical protein